VVDLWKANPAIGKPGSVRVGLLGFGNVGRKVILNNADRYYFSIYWIADSRNLVSKTSGHPFTKREMRRLVQIKDQYPGCFGEKCRREIAGSTIYELENAQQEAKVTAEMITEPRENWVIIDTTTLSAQAGRTLARNFMGCAAYCTANKNPWADHNLCTELYREAERTQTLLGLNCVAGVWVDQMEILPIVLRHLERGRLAVVKRDNSSLNLFFEKVGSGIRADDAIATITATGHMEPSSAGLENEVQDQRLKARIAANVTGLLKGFRVDLSHDSLSQDSPSDPKTLDPKDIADWHVSGRKKKLYPSLITEITVETEANRISCAVGFQTIPRGHPLAKDFGGKSAILVQAFDDTRFDWSDACERKKSGRFVHSGFGGGVKTAEKLLWEARRAIGLVEHFSMSTFSPLPILWALDNQETCAKRLEKKLANSL
jgi:homoserine dehydrogenase